MLSKKSLLLPTIVRTLSGVLIVVGLVAVVVNLVTALLVHRGSESDLNLRSAFVHLMGDVLSTIGAVIAGILIYFTGANWLDPVVSVLIGILILYNAWGILRDAVDILLEATPRDVDMKKWWVTLSRWKVCSASMIFMSGVSPRTCAPCPLTS
jgi:cation diffusion facilitator family transporter